MDKIKVLNVHGGMLRGGTEAVIMNIYRNINRNKFDISFTTTFSEECPYDKEIKKIGGRLIYINSRAKVGFIKHCKELYGLFKKEKYDVIHSHMNFHGGIVALLGKLAGCKKVVCHAHNTQDDGMGIKRKIEIVILRSLIKKFSDQLVACGKEAGEFVFGNNAKYLLLNNAVDLNKFNPIESVKSSKLKNDYGLKDVVILGHVGRFMKQKNHKFIIEIMEGLSKRYDKFKFVFIGEGELQDEFIKSIKTKKLEKYVLILNARDDVEEWLKIFDMMVFPSLYEGLPVTLIEAQAAGLKCLISDKISKDVDIGLDLIDFIEINKKSEEKWINSILKYKDKEIRLINTEKIKEKMNEKGYYLDGIIQKISDVYEGR